MSAFAKGSRYLTRADVSCICLIHAMAPGTGGCSVVVPKGTVLVVKDPPVPWATGVGFFPEGGLAVIKSLIPPHRYRIDCDYTLVIGLSEIENSCSKLDNAR